MRGAFSGYASLDGHHPGGGGSVGRTTGYAALPDYNRAIRDIALSADWQSGSLARQMGRVVEVGARYMGVGRASVWRLQPDHRVLDCVVQFDSRKGLHHPGQTFDATHYPGYFAALAADRALAVSDARHDPATAELVDSYLGPLQITSVLHAPIRLDGTVAGVVCHEHSGQPRVWRDEDIAFAGSMADFAAMALSQDRYQRVEATRDRLARILEATPDLVALMTVDGYLLQLNLAGRRLLGLSDDADVTRFRSRDFLGPHAIKLLEGEILPALRASGRWTGEAELREGTSQALPVSVVALAHRDAAKAFEYFSVTLRDLSEQKAVQRRIETLNEELEARVRARTRALQDANRSLESFAYSVSHDLKAPLRGIEGYTRLLAAEYRAELPGEAAEFVDLIADASHRMDGMIEDILAYSRIQMRPLQAATVEAGRVVQEVVAEFAAQARAGAVMEQDVEPGAIECDREGTMQILRNFLSNALKFAGSGDAAHIRVEGRRLPGGYRFAVRDNGPGFDMRYHDRIFQLFHRLPEASAQPGTGIGLALAARAAEQMGGRVWAESAPGKGAAFFFELYEGALA